MRLRVRLVLLFGLLVAVATAASGFLSYSATRDEAMTAVDQFLEGRFRRIPATDGEPPGSTSDEFARLLERSGPTGESAPGQRIVGDDSVLTVIGPDGETVFTSDASVALPVPDLSAGESALSSVEIEDVRYRLRVEAFDDATTVLNARSLSEVDATLAAVRNRLLVIALAVTLTAVLVAWFVAGRLARPLQRLSAAAEHITATGDLATPLETGASGEVGQVASSFGKMLAAFERSRQQQQRLVVDAGHELRTPLTTLRGNVELLASGRLNDSDRARALDLIGSEVEELSNLTAELVELAGDQPVHDEMTTVDLFDVADAAAARARSRSGREIVVGGTRTQLLGNAAGLDRAVSNLLGNALKFSTDGTPIAINVSAGAIDVANSGEPIPEEDLDQVFERFYRAPTSRSLPGSGLGLAIVAAVAVAHGGAPFARNRTDGVDVGFTFAHASGSDEPPNCL